MTKNKRGRKTPMNTDTPNNAGSPSSPHRPRLDPHKRQLSRFYEPLVLLYTLGRTRGNHTCAMLPHQNQMSYLPLKDMRRRFLSELAYVCDYDKGGDTVTAIGLEATPQGHIFWVASNSSSKTKTLPFLESLLAKLRHISFAAGISLSEEAINLAAYCINFATPRIKKYKSHLKPLLRKCLQYLATTARDDVHGLAGWLISWECDRTPFELCRFAYEARKSTFMRALGRLSTEPSYKSSDDAIHHTFSLVRHYIGRLGHHFRAGKVLISCASRLSGLLDNTKVCNVPAIAKSTIPPADGMTTLDGVATRMLPASSPEQKDYQQALADMDAKYQLSRRFLENYTAPSLKPCVHAEIRVLEQLYIRKSKFPDGDPFIACSKPACFCCLLYFRSHPGHFVEPLSHCKIYLNWRPPDLRDYFESVGEHHQRDILNAMTRDIRKETLQQVREKTAPHAWHPDSLTGITESAVHQQQLEEWEETDNISLVSKDSATLNSASSMAELLRIDEMNLGGKRGQNEQLNIISQLESSLEGFLDDSDTEGGVLL